MIIKPSIPSKILLIVLAASVFIPPLIRSIPVFLIIVFLGSGLFLSKFNRLKTSVADVNLVFMVLASFFFLGLLYVIVSFLSNGWVNNYFYGQNFIVRQSYFVFFFPLFIVSGMAIFSALEKKTHFFMEKHASILFLSILILDFILAFFLGDPVFRENNGYTYWLDKTLLWFFVCYLYFFTIIYTSNKSTVFFVATIFFFLERIFGYGQMFNASTGLLLFFYMTLFYFVIKFFKVQYRIWLFIIWGGSIVAVLSFVFIAPFFYDVFEFDLNTYWRLKSWHDNLIAVVDNYGFGVGFGVSYFPNSSDVYEQAYSLFNSDRSFGNSITDFLFIRGQHSSFVNIFFRLGAIGLILFLLFYILMFRIAKPYHQDRAVLLTSALLVCGLSNIAFHVGLESPPFLITIALSTGFLLEVISSLKRLAPIENSVNYKEMI